MLHIRTVSHAWQPKSQPLPFLPPTFTALEAAFFTPTDFPWRPLPLLTKSTLVLLTIRSSSLQIFLLAFPY